MPQNRKGRKSRNGPRRNKNSRNNLNMKQLLQVQRTQERSLPPMVFDVQKILMPRESIAMFERSFTASNVVPSTTTPVAGSIRISMDSLPNYTEFTSLFDAYRILQSTVTFFPVVNMNTTASGVTTSSLLSVIDYDDDTVLGSINEALQYPSLMQSAVGSIVERTFNPCAANAAYGGAFTSYARMPRSTWVDAASTNVRYYGLKWIVDTSANATPLWTITVRVVLQCKNVR